MPYVLGIDIGGTTTIAAVSRPRREGWSVPEVVRLSARAAAVPSVLRLATDGTLGAGEPDPHASAPDTGLTARGFLRRIGDEVPQFIGVEAWTPESLTAALAHWVVERVAATEAGRGPERIVLSHPGSWGPYRTGLLRRAVREAGLGDVVLLPEPVTAAESHASRGFTGRTLAVYALGGENHAASVVRRTPTGRFELLSCLEGIEPLGGAHLDDALLRHVRDQLAARSGRTPAGSARPSPPELPAACTQAKEQLTVATEADVRIHLPEGPTRVPITRAEFEQMIRPAVRLTVETLNRAVRSAALRPEQLDGVLLIGGGARIPLVAELIAARFPGPLMVEADPAVTAAAGAARVAAQIADPGRPGPGTPPPRRPAGPGDHGGEPHRDGPRDPAPPPVRRPDPPPPGRAEPPPRPPVRISPLNLPRMRSPRRPTGDAVAKHLSRSGSRS